MLHFRYRVPGVMDGDEPRSFVTLYEFEGCVHIHNFISSIPTPTIYQLVWTVCQLICFFNLILFPA